ncbi:retinitis pigmentosa 9 protein [Leucoraja erinacea]|uniref:retinitis pigmentosa 9 protein n=1 Tax=Leucoraja erinaceus TaxID=7782 RepID=UPI0024589258|nr:retinitis pigmentosa 9 protein [Leucoraja erinacea]
MAEGSRASGKERRHRRRSAEDREPERKKKKRLHQEVKKIKHVETFYEKPPPGMIKEDDDKPEDCIPDLPGNEEARDFLAHAPTRGLWMPLGKEVKVMQCWRCKNFGHRTGDRECPYFISGNQKLEQFRVVSQNTFHNTLFGWNVILLLLTLPQLLQVKFSLTVRQERLVLKVQPCRHLLFCFTSQSLIIERKKNRHGSIVSEDRYLITVMWPFLSRIQQLKQMLEDSTSDSQSSSSSDSRERLKKKRKRKEKKRKKKKKRKKHKAEKSSDSSE